MIFLLFFRTEVPDQLVVLDPQLAAVDQNYTRILQRYKVGFLVDHLLEAGITVFSVSGSSRDTRWVFWWTISWRPVKQYFPCPDPPEIQGGVFVDHLLRAGLRCIWIL